ncbi:uncharacterized protein [Gossypium hirsutum]|uniref:Retrotransposon gag domain-containing protein n=1 Tax=Gossypium hirsutum TaxID=3635 RepID=A0ABM3A9M2_GOSHI|nr:uncharacterized protein LOC121218419 [Gossypium hirsutum]
MYDYAKPTLIGVELSVVRSTIVANNSELKPNTIQMIQSYVQFDEICDTFKINGATDDAIRLRLFPFSLRRKEKQWLTSLPRGSITTWAQMTQKLLLKYFPPAKTTKLGNNISSFTQIDLETLYDACERFKYLLRRCPHYGLPLWLQVQTYYNGLNHSTRLLIDAAAGGTLNNKTPEETYEFIEEVALNSYKWQVMRTKLMKATDVFNLDAVVMLSSQVEALNKKIDGLNFSTQVNPVIQYDANRVGMINSECLPFSSIMENEQQPYQQGKKLNLEEMLEKFISVLETRFQNIETTLKNQQASIQWLENQIGQLAKLVLERLQGSLPSNTETNPREKLHVLTVLSVEGLVELEQKLKLEAIENNDKVEKSKKEQKEVVRE